MRSYSNLKFIGRLTWNVFVHAVELAVVDAEELRVRDLVLARDPPTLSCKRTKKKKRNDLSRVLTRVLIISCCEVDRGEISIVVHFPESTKIVTVSVRQTEWLKCGAPEGEVYGAISRCSKEARKRPLVHRPSVHRPLPPPK